MLRVLPLVFLVLTGIAITILPLAAAKPAPGIHPIVDAEWNEFFGGVVDGFWTKSKKMLTRVKGGEFYRLYSFSKYVGLGIGGKVFFTEDPEVGAPCLDVTLPRYMKRDQTLIGVCGNWNALPRVPKLENPKQPAYQTIIRGVLKQHGLPNAAVNIRKVVRIDLDGDGKDELIINATTSRQSYPDARPRQNDYSLVVLCKNINGKMVTIPVEEEYYQRNLEFAAPNEYTLEAVLDTNGDGVMEIIIGWVYYDGIGKSIYEYKNSKMHRVLDSGWGI
jgi:hypothetical protein